MKSIRMSDEKVDYHHSAPTKSRVFYWASDPCGMQRVYETGFIDK